MGTRCGGWCADSHRLPRLGLVLAMALAATPRVATATDESLAVSLRAGTAQEAAQGTLKSGFSVELLADRATGGPVDFGLGVSFARDPGGGTYSRDRVLVSSIAARARSPLRNRAHVELGLGYYWISREGTSSPSPGSSSGGGMGGFIGGGYELWRNGDVGLGLALAYHMIAADVAYSSGNLEDYYSFAGTFRWGGVAR